MQKPSVTLRNFPYPFRAALVICSDIDRTKTLERFLAIQEFLNTTRNTSMGPGIGLEIGNSFFPYTSDDSFGYFSSRPEDRNVIETLIKAGYIDCLHSYGNGVCSRSDAIRALEEFEHRGCKLDVWINHSRAPSNFGKDTAPGLGDVIDSPIYHADVTLAYGIRYIWKGRGSSIVGHGVPFSYNSFLSIFDKDHPAYSLKNIGKELVKIILAYLGYPRFAIHRQNQLLHVDHLRDGQFVYEFQRCNNYWRGLSYGHNSDGLAYVIRPKALRDLITAEGCMIIYTHLGVGPDRPPFIPPQTQKALRYLADIHRNGDIYVTTTSRILNYYLNHRYLRWSYEVNQHGWIQIAIHGVSDPIFGFHVPSLDELQGITFYVPRRNKVKVYLGDKQLRIKRNPADHTNRESVMIPRTFLTYPL